MPEIELVHWNPRRRLFRGRLTRHVPISGRRVSNFGDLLGPRVVNQVLNAHGISNSGPKRGVRLVSIGSVMHLARDGDTVWGTGVNGKHIDESLPFTEVDVRAVRGPLTRQHMLKNGYYVPEVFGDPGLLVGELWPHLKTLEKLHALTIVPNLNDFTAYRGRDDVLNPRSDLDDCLSRIARSDFVVGSSLHAVIVAESLGIPARLISSSVEPSFKYEDYYLGSGRTGYKAAQTVSQAIEFGGETLPSWDSSDLFSSFPLDLWTNAVTSHQ